MKKIALMLVMLLATATTFAQITINGKSLKEFNQEYEVKMYQDSIIDIVEELVESGKFNMAIEKLDELKRNPPQLPEWKLYGQYFFYKIHLFSEMQDWDAVLRVADDYDNSNPDYDSDEYAPMIFSSTATAYSAKENYTDAIKSNEKALDLYEKRDKPNDVAQILGAIGYSYALMEKDYLAKDFLDKSIDKYLKYFKTEPKELIKKKYKLSTESKTELEIQKDEASLQLFGTYLYGRAILADKDGDRKEMKKLLKMGINCGSKLCKKYYNEY